jgi:hypothetical protein
LNIWVGRAGGKHWKRISIISIRSDTPKSRISFTGVWMYPCKIHCEIKCVLCLITHLTSKHTIPLRTRIGSFLSRRGMLILSIYSPLEVNVETVNPAAQAWKCLRGKIAAEILIAPKTGGDPHNAGDWPAVPLRVVGYLERNIIGNSWADTLALLAALMAARRYEMNTVFSKLVVLHARFKALFQTLILEEMADWDATQYIPGYLKGEFLPSDSQSTRQRFWVDYHSASKLMSQWLANLPTEQQQVYSRVVVLGRHEDVGVEGRDLR